jgi:hypothetical protein
VKKLDIPPDKIGKLAMIWLVAGTLTLIAIGIIVICAIYKILPIHDQDSGQPLSPSKTALLFLPIAISGGLIAFLGAGVLISRKRRGE